MIMPLLMDFHKINYISIEAVKSAYNADTDVLVIIQLL